MKIKWIVIVLLALVGVVFGIILYYPRIFVSSSRTRTVMAFLRNPKMHQESIIPARSRCDEAPFIFPTTGMIGFIWGDSFRPGHHHQGIDIFSGEAVGEVPIFAAYEGYLTRLDDWKSTVIIRIPSDPLQPESQIWTYYTHMADASGNSLIADAFPPGTADVYVEAGALLGFQGNYSGTPGNPTGIHLHFSIVKDDGKGIFLNELEMRNTVDPSPYFGMALNASENPDGIPTCDNP